MKLRIMNFELRILAGILITLCALLFALCSAAEAADWSGVDESVVEKYAEEHGRASVDPLINTDQGDLLLFMFLLGGAVGGFFGGYYWRMLMEGRSHSVST
ncbi:MAG: cobalt ABC transporter permease [Nitrospirota bacterium]